MADPDYFTLAEFRIVCPDIGEATDPQVLAAAAYFTTIVEREIGEPLIPRTFTQTIDGTDLPTLVLGHTNVRSLTAVTVGGVTIDPASLSSTNGVLRYTSNYYPTGIPWTLGASNIVVTYVAGAYATCPADVKDAVMWATRDRLMAQSDQAGIDTRRTSVTTEFGTTNYVLPGENRPTGYPDLDAVIASYRRNTPSYGFA